MNNQKQKVAELSPKEKDEYIQTLEILLTEREKVLEAIPECSMHGPQCVPNALEWIEKQIAKNNSKSVESILTPEEWGIVESCEYKPITLEIRDDGEFARWSRPNRFPLRMPKSDPPKG